MEFSRRFDLLQIISFFSLVPPRPAHPPNLSYPIRIPIPPESFPTAENMDSMIEVMGRMEVTKRPSWSMREGIKNKNPQPDLVLVGRVLQEKQVNSQAFTETITPILSNASNLRIESIGANRFILTFKVCFDYTRTLEEGPWHFDRALLVLTPLSPNQDPTQIEIKHCQFWVHLQNLPYFKLTKEIAMPLTQSLGKFVGMDVEQLREGWASKMRFRLEVDVEEPLFKELDITKMDGTVVTTGITYEKLLNFCYICGKLTHIDRQCLKRVLYENSDIRPFGDALREPQFRRPQRLKQMVEKPHGEKSTPTDGSPPSMDSRNVAVDDHEYIRQQMVHQANPKQQGANEQNTQFGNDEFRLEDLNPEGYGLGQNWELTDSGDEALPDRFTPQVSNKRSQINLNEEEVITNSQLMDQPPAQQFQLVQNTAYQGGGTQDLHAGQSGVHFGPLTGTHAVQWINNIMPLSPSLHLDREEPSSSRAGSKRQRTERHSGSTDTTIGPGWIFTGHQH